MRYLLLILSLLVAQPAAAIIIKQGPGGSGDASVRSAADCTAETGGTEDEVCVETGTGQGVFRCSTATCEGAGWERADDTVGAGGGIVNTIAAVDGGGASSGADIIMGTGAGLDTFHAGDTITYSFDPTELVNLTWGTGSQLAWTFNAGATDPVMTVNSDQVDWTNVATFTLDTEQVISTPVGDGESLAVTGSGSVEATLVTVPATTTAGQSPLAVDQAVHVNGYDAVNGCVEVILADADDGALMPAIGISTATLTDGDCDGEVTVSGTAVGAFGALTPNDSLYVSATAGALTSTKPTGTALIQKLAEALQEGGASDRIQIFGAGRSNDVPNIPDDQMWIGSSSGVATASALPAGGTDGCSAAGDKPLYTASTNSWSCGSDGGGGVSTDEIGTDELDDGADTPLTGEYLRVDTVDQAGIEYRTAAETRADLGLVLGTNAQAWDAELDVIAALAETNGNVMFVAGGAWTSDATPAIDCTDCTNIPAGSHTGTITWGGTSVLESGAAFGFGDGTDATLTHTYANTGTDVTIAYSTAAMAITGALTATSYGGVTEANLVDKTATESISGAWDWTDSGTFDFGGAVTGTSFTADASATPSMVLTDSTTSGEVAIAMDDGAGPDGRMQQQVDVAGTLTTFVELDGINSDIELGTPGTNYVDITTGGVMTFVGTGDIDLPATSVDDADLNMTTPALGTPSALVLTNATGLPTAGIVDANVTEDKLAATLTFDDADLLDFGTNISSATEGILLPKHATSCASATGEGQICWDADDDSATGLWVGDGATARNIGSGGGGESLAATLALGADGNDVDMTSLGRLEFFDAGLYFDADADGVMDITSDGTLELHSADWDISTTGVITGAGNITSDGTVTAVTVSGNAAADLDVDANGQNVTLGDGGTTNYLAVADDGTMTTNGSAGIYTDSTVSIPAAAWVLSTTPPTESTYGTNYPESVLDFPDGSDTQSFVKLAIPTDFNDTNQANMTWVIRWTSDVGTGTACFCVAADPLQNGDDPDLNTGTVTSCEEVSASAADDLEETTFTMSASTFETAEMMNVRLYRDADAGAGACASDTLTGSASVIAVTLNYGVLKQ